MRILLIEDDKDLCKCMCYPLKKEAYVVDCCYDGEDGLQLVLEEAYDLIILDRMLPSLDGLTVLQHIRKQGLQTPVLMVTALSEISDRVAGLDAGADDYLTKPFATEELMARVRALSRRPVHWENQNKVTFEDVSLDLATFLLTGPTNSFSLSKREASLAEVFLKNPHTLLPRNLILSKVWGPSAPVEDGNIDNYIHFLRRRLKTVGSSLQIKTMRGVGYLLEGKDAE